MQENSALQDEAFALHVDASLHHDEAAEAANRLDRRNTLIVSVLGFAGVLISGILLIVAETVR